nr:PAS domain S-box protein [uncultured Draconibacterium sp.]
MKNFNKSVFNSHFFELSQDLMCVAGFDGYFKYLNPAWEKSLGYSNEKLLSKPFLSFIHPDDHSKNNEEVSNLSKGNFTINFENRYICKNGSVKYFEWTATPLPEEKIMYCIGRDITKRKQLEVKSNEHSSDLSFLNSIAIPLADIHPNDKFIETILKQIKDYTGATLALFNHYNPQKRELKLNHIDADQGILNTILKIAGKAIAQTATPVDNETYKLITADSVATLTSFYDVTFGAIPKSIDKAIRTTTGIDRLYPITHIVEGKLYGTTMLAFKKDHPSPSMELLESYAHLLSVALRRHNAEKAKEESEKEFRLLFENMEQGFALHEMVYDKNENPVDYRFVLINKAFERLTGMSAKKFIGKTFKQVLPDAEQIWVENYGKVAKTGKAIHFEHYSQLFNKYYNVVAYSPKKNFFATIFSDTTQHVLNRKKLLEAKERAENSDYRLKLAVESGNLGIWDLDLEKNSLEWNDRMYELYGITKKEFTNNFEAWEKGVHPDDVEEAKKEVNLAISGQKKFNTSFRVIQPDNTIRYITANGIVIRDKAGNPTRMIGINRDITEIRKRAKELKESYDLLHNLTAQVPGVVYQYRMYPDGKSAFPFSSPGMYTIYELTPEEVREDASSVLTRIHPDDIDYIVDEINKSAKNQTLFDSEFRVILPKQGLRWRYCVAKPQILEDGSTLWHGIISDITDQKAYIREIQEKNHFIQTVLDNLPIGVALNKFNDGTATYMNKKFTEIYGWPESVLSDVSNFFLHIYPDKDYRERIVAQIMKDINSGNPEQMHWENIKITQQNGQQRIIDTVNIPLIEQNIMVATVMDMTKQYNYSKELIKAKEKAENSEIRFKAISEQAMDGIALTDLEANYVFVNKSFCRMMGYTEQELLKMKVFELRAPDAEGDFFRRFREGKNMRNSTRTKLVRKDKSILYVDLNGSFLNVGSKQYILGIHRDVTELVTRENELIKAKEKAEESDRLKSAFLANMSHEIRTPMNGILGFASLLRSPNLNNAEQDKYINIIEASGARMLNTINDIIDISKIESGQVELSESEIDLNLVLCELFDFFLPETQKKNIELSFINRSLEKQFTIKTDKYKLNSILTNLIKNAIKYTHNGKIDFGYIQHENNDKSELEFFVTDTGIGIPANRQKAIFERFVQADIEDKQAYEGSGLGLAITKAYVEMLGGSIGVESKVGKGSKFYFTLPYSTTQQKQQEKQTSTDMRDNLARSLKILIVEDDEFSITYLKIALKDFSENMLVAQTGIEAVEICKNNPDIDLILMDMKMPKMDGFEATRAIREFNKKVFIVAQTAYAQVGDRKEVLEAGCNAYLTKPINKKELLKIISSRT